MVISIILIPYFGRPDARATQQELRITQASAAQTKTQAEQARQQIADLQAQVADLEKQLSKSSLLALFGIVTHANSVAIVVDLSGSIDNRQNEPNSIDYRPQVLKVCSTIIDGLKPGQKLQILGFHSPNASNPELPQWKKAAVPLDAPAQQAAKNFVVQILNTVSGGTPTGPALRKALAEDVEAIFLITDGAPTEGRRGGQDLCDEIAAQTTTLNNGKKEIHCIAVGKYNSAPFCVDFLMRVARENRGQFLGMPDL